jgi:hypothetical protein
LIGGVLWWFFGRKLLTVVSVRDVDLPTVVTVKGDDELAKAIGSQLKRSLLWRLYAKHLPPAEITPGKPPIEIPGRYKRHKNEPKGELPEASHSPWPIV